jgi:hypothetical protein
VTDRSRGSDTAAEERAKQGDAVKSAVERALQSPAIREAIAGLDREEVIRRATDAAVEKWVPSGPEEERFREGEAPAEPLRRSAAWFVASLVAVLGGAVAALVGFITSSSANTGVKAAAAAVAVLVTFTATLFAARRARRTRVDAERVQEEVLEKQRRARERLEGELVLPELRAVINELRETRFGRTFRPDHVSGLKDLSDPKYDVPTGATTELTELLTRRLEKGSVGVAGPRGAGKTTLLRVAAEGRLPWDKEVPPLGVIVSAPVRYEAREFIPHLFAKLCLRVLGPIADKARVDRARRERLRSLLTLGAVTYGLAAVVAGAYAATAKTAGQRPWVLTLAITAGAGAALMLVLPPLLSRMRATRYDDSLEGQAREHLQALRYLETRSEEWSSELSMKAAKIAGKTSVSLAAQPFTIPELTSNYEDFVTRIAAKRAVVIGIDELDKMASIEEAQRFLNDIKSLFGQPQAYYLISLSDDAMSAFEQRGLPLRDVFESVFDDVLRVEPLRLSESATLLRRRVIGMPPPFAGLCHALSGGLPRELIRAAREAVWIAKTLGKPELATVAQRLVADRAQSREVAAEVVARRHLGIGGKQPVLRWLRGLDPNPDAAELYHRTDVGTVALAVRGLPAADALELLLAEFAAWSYHAATVLDFFSSVDEASYRFAAAPSGDVESPLDVLAEEAGYTFTYARSSDGQSPLDVLAEGQSPLDLLARSSLDLGLAPELAWETTSTFRRLVDLPPHDCPLTVEDTPTAVEGQTGGQ